MVCTPNSPPIPHPPPAMSHSDLKCLYFRKKKKKNFYYILLLFIKVARKLLWGFRIQESGGEEKKYMCPFQESIFWHVTFCAKEGALCLAYNLLPPSLALKTVLQNKRGKKTKPELSCSLFSWKTNYFLLVKHFLRNKTAAQ